MTIHFYLSDCFFFCFLHYRWAEVATSKLGREGITLQEQDVIFNLRVSGSESALQFQETVISSLLVPTFAFSPSPSLTAIELDAGAYFHGFDF